jgi:hypothetical protein
MSMVVVVAVVAVTAMVATRITTVISAMVTRGAMIIGAGAVVATA